MNTTGGQGAVFPVPNEGASVPHFAADANSIFFRTIALDSARTNEVLTINGTFLYAIDASSLTAKLSIAFNDSNGDGLPFYKGQALKGWRYDKLYLTNTAQAGETITLVYGVIPDFGLVNPANQFTSVSVSKASTLGTIADVTCANAAKTKVFTADSTVRTVMIRNPTGGGELRVGDTNVAAARGIALYAGEQLSIDCYDDVYVYNNSGAGIDVQVTTIAD